MHWDAVYFTTVHHDGHGSCIDGSLERGKEIFAQLAFWNPGGGAVFSGQREAVTKEMLQRRSEWNISVLVPLDHRYAEA